jgi:RimJ/RimL family protein N-acetyltransferase
MHDDLVVRKATETDIRSMVSLSESVTSERLAWRNDEVASAESFQALFTEVLRCPNSIVLVAERQRQIIGELECLEREPDHSEFVIWVHREHRQVGVGSALLRALVEWAECQRDLSRLQAKVLKPNIGSRRLLERFAFSELDREPHVSTIRGAKIPEILYYRDLEHK